ncbi:MAG: M23 family metallopeptidase, partial [Campylobacter sp.]
ELPLNSKITSAFGNARTFNGELKSYHSGTDYRAAVGTGVRAANDGVVVIAKDRYYAGGSVVIDHGGGIYSQYYHLSEIKVALGDHVHKGDEIALSGESGRVSGPHLHFGIAINGVSVNPLSFVAKFNEVVFGER